MNSAAETAELAQRAGQNVKTICEVGSAAILAYHASNRYFCTDADANFTVPEGDADFWVGFYAPNGVKLVIRVSQIRRCPPIDFPLASFTGDTVMVKGGVLELIPVLSFSLFPTKWTKLSNELKNKIEIFIWQSISPVLQSWIGKFARCNFCFCITR